MKESDNFKQDATILEFVKDALKRRMKAETAFEEYRENQTRSNEKEFKTKLDRLYVRYFDLFNKRTEIERPAFAEEEGLLDNKQPRDCRDLNFEQSKALLFQIMRLQEKLGHTSIDSQEWEEETI